MKGESKVMSRETHFTYYRCKLQSTGSNVTRMVTKVRLASQHVVVAHDDSGSNHSVDAKLPLPRLGIPVVMVGHRKVDK